MGSDRGSRRATVAVPARVAMLALSLLALVPGHAGADEAPSAERSWSYRVQGLEVRAVEGLKIHPKEADRLLAHVHGLGIARSTDEGQTWTAMHEGIDQRHLPGPRDVVEIALDARDDQTIWLVTQGHVYRSEDGGERWESKTTGALASFSHDRRRNAMLIRGVAVDPSKSLRVLAGTRPGPEWQGGLFESTDGGKSWETIAGSSVPKSELGAEAWPILLDPSTDKNIVVGGAGGLWVSDDRGRKFKRAEPVDVGAREVRSLERIGGRGKDLLLANPQGVWHSRDGGKRWGSEPVLQGDAVLVVADPHSRKRAYAVVRGRGLLLSEDSRHQKWESLGHDELDIHGIGFHPRDKELMYLTSPLTGLHVSRDRGETVTPANDGVPPVVPGIVAAVLHPAEGGHALAVSEHGSVHHSEDSGLTWSLRGRLGMHAEVLVPDPSSAGAFFAAGTTFARTADHGATWQTLYEPEDPSDRIVSAARLESGRLLLLLERAHVVVASDDGGKTWTPSAAFTRLPTTHARMLAVDPRDPDHLLVASASLAAIWTAKDDEGGPWESWDGGKTWKRPQEGLGTARNPLPDWNRGHVVAIDGSGLMFYGADGAGLFVRQAVKPGGEAPKVPAEWAGIPLPLPTAGVTAFLLAGGSSAEDRTLYLQLEGENDTRTLLKASTAWIRRWLETAVAERAALGSAWTVLPDPGAPLASLVEDPRAPGRLLGADLKATGGVLVFEVPAPKAPQKPAEAVPE